MVVRKAVLDGGMHHTKLGTRCSAGQGVCLSRSGVKAKVATGTESIVDETALLPHEAGRLCAACWCAACSANRRAAAQRQGAAAESRGLCSQTLPIRCARGGSPLSAGPSRGSAIGRPCLPTPAASRRSARGGLQTLHKLVQGSGGGWAAAGCTARRRWFTEFGVV